MFSVSQYLGWAGVRGASKCNEGLGQCNDTLGGLPPRLLGGMRWMDGMYGGGLMEGYFIILEDGAEKVA